ncbi:hypothetical protein C9F11_46420 (plasmid) [Streptomyces sp. YIM 121038]|nr:hypothetical protein C9F11_46420 [Streptomyces sp. YIM 121038]
MPTGPDTSARGAGARPRPGLAVRRREPAYDLACRRHPGQLLLAHHQQPRAPHGLPAQPLRLPTAGRLPLPQQQEHLPTAHPAPPHPHQLINSYRNEKPGPPDTHSSLKRKRTQAKLDLADRVLATALQQNLALPPTVLARLFAVSKDTIRHTTSETRRLMNQHARTLRPPAAHLNTLAGLLVHATTHGATLTTEIKPTR